MTEQGCRVINRLAMRCALLLALAGVGLLARAAAGQESSLVPVLADRANTEVTAGHRAANPVSPAPLHVLVARVAANEDSRPLRPVRDGGTAGALTEDSRAIWQTTLAWARWQRTTPLRAINALAPHVSGSRAPKLPRHALYASLPARGHARPALWVDSEHGPWAAYGPHWARFREAVKALVDGAAVRPCDGEPIAWGGPMDDRIAIRRGLVRLACGAAVNGFWALPAERVIAANVAAGRRP